MEALAGLLLIAALGWIVIDFLGRAFKGPYRCSCGFETYNADEALRHQGHKSHTVE